MGDQVGPLELLLLLQELLLLKKILLLLLLLMLLLLQNKLLLLLLKCQPMLFLLLLLLLELELLSWIDAIVKYIEIVIYNLRMLLLLPQLILMLIIDNPLLVLRLPLLKSLHLIIIIDVKATAARGRVLIFVDFLDDRPRIRLAAARLLLRRARMIERFVLARVRLQDWNFVGQVKEAVAEIGLRSRDRIGAFFAKGFQLVQGQQVLQLHEHNILMALDGGGRAG